MVHMEPCALTERIPGVQIGIQFTANVFEPKEMEAFATLSDSSQCCSAFHALVNQSMSVAATHGWAALPSPEVFSGLLSAQAPCSLVI